ncbi:GMC family oxidoreductase [Planosporangium flavigriseum]|uniref:Cholesterol oxidase n=1 Tax=Planosporangium flavigriseum TaxID=373681 RepID=A0A8J3PKZ7_9ACTN|nr:GMC family oxidoreductase [Planosporangium flavigriseum]NJC64823.1 GMC family oxidoreductase [Planosporangium flavigriseum]GIG72694.1 cholesterol oxidase [Planosporangium flavigriseum]
MRYDVVIIGSGFGGSVAALRLVEKGYKVAVLEAGRRFADSDFPKTSWRSRKFLWAPALGCYGIQRINLLRDVLVLSGAGVGGGSLVYANTLYRPLKPFYADPQWVGVTDWEQELAPHYDQAERMLGVVTYNRMTRADEAMKRVAARMGVEDTFHPTPVGVYLGQPGVDPFFGGAGPVRNACHHCGACMTGCRFNAKNTLVKNYLYLAEQGGAEVRPLTTVDIVRPGAQGGYVVEAHRTGRTWKRHTFEADQVIFAAGSLGTQRVLHRSKAAGALPALSGRLGALTRTNSEAILGARTFNKDADYTDGVAITSSFHPDANTHIEPVRYGKGSNAMGLLQTVLTDGGPRRMLRWWGVFFSQPWKHLRVLSVRRWSERTVIALVMQSLDNSLQTHYRRGWLGRKRLTTTQGHGAPNPTWVPAGNQAVRLLAEEIDGVPGGSWGEVFNIPMTAHILGGAPIGADASKGVVDPYHRVFGHPGLHVVDGAAVSANLGVNPSLTITAQAERAMSMWPNKGEADPRPPLGSPYERVEPVAPRSPAVPATAPAALRLLPR